nr:hypothetical protein [Marinicella sp. W31]MDC2875869.1 hypothetical protein [Marinicella sp. W31]
MRMKETHQSQPVSGLRLFWKRKTAAKSFSIAATRWPWFLFPAATMALLFLATLDGPVAVARDAMSPAFQDVAGRMTDLTTAPWILVVSGVVALAALAFLARSSTVSGRYRAVLIVHQASYVFATVALASATVNVVKRLIGRARPTLFESVGDLHFNVGGWAYDYASFPPVMPPPQVRSSPHLRCFSPDGAGFCLRCDFLRICSRCCRSALSKRHFGRPFYGAWVAVLMSVIFAHYRLLFATPEKGCRGAEVLPEGVAELRPFAGSRAVRAGMLCHCAGMPQNAWANAPCCFKMIAEPVDPGYCAVFTHLFVRSNR